MSERRYQQYLIELSKRLNTVRSGLSSVGLSSIQLETQSLIELFYNTYNPELAETEKITDVGKLQVEGT
jgi:hypothetical protein